jgi:hypothetical protein
MRSFFIAGILINISKLPYLVALFHVMRQIAL